MSRRRRGNVRRRGAGNSGGSTPEADRARRIRASGGGSARRRHDGEARVRVEVARRGARGPPRGRAAAARGGDLGGGGWNRADAGRRSGRPRCAVPRCRDRRGEHAPGGLDQEPARAAVAAFGDRTAVLLLARTALAGHQPQVGGGRMRSAEALHPIERSDEAQGGDRPNTGNGLESPHHRIVRSVPGQPCIGGRDLQVECLHHREQR